MKSLRSTLKKNTILSLLFAAVAALPSQGQHAVWRLWSEGLPSGVYPRMTVAPNHDIFYTLLGAGNKLGLIFRSNTKQTFGSFTPMPQVPRPSSIQNNIVALGYNRLSEPIAGIYRTDLSQPWLFRWNETMQRWDTSQSNIQPTLGGHCLATAENGVIYLGARWAYIYKSTDDGSTFTAIDESSQIKSKYPCYYPSYNNGSEQDGAIFGIQIDRKGRVYAGTETSGVIFSDDEGTSWHPVDSYACRTEDSTQKDTMSPLLALSLSGNVAGLGFTKEDNLIWSGPDMWRLGWKNKMGFADLNTSITKEVEGLPDYLIQTGQQVSKIVTTKNGHMFFHSGSSNGSSPTQIGIYSSWDGIHWSLFNDGISGMNDGLSQGSLAVDENKVFMATRDGKIWMLDDTVTVSKTHSVSRLNESLQLMPNPVVDVLTIQSEMDITNMKISLADVFGKNQSVSILYRSKNELHVGVTNTAAGIYYLRVNLEGHASVSKTFIKL